MTYRMPDDNQVPGPEYAQSPPPPPPYYPPDPYQMQPPLPPPSPPRKNRTPLIVTLIIVGALVVIGGGLGIYFGTSSSSSGSTNHFSRVTPSASPTHRVGFYTAHDLVPSIRSKIQSTLDKDDLGHITQLGCVDMTKRHWECNMVIRLTSGGMHRTTLDVEVSSDYQTWVSK